MKAKKILIILVLLFTALQLVPVERTNPPVKSDLKASVEVKNILNSMACIQLRCTGFILSGRSC